MADVIQWYQSEYRFAQNNTYLGRDGDVHTITIDNQLLDERRIEGLFLNLDRMILLQDGKLKLQRSQSTARVYVASDEFCKLLPDNVWPVGQRVNIGSYLTPEMFTCKRDISDDVEGRNHLECNLINHMLWIITSPSPLLLAAQVNTQAEFDRTFRTIVRKHEYQGKNYSLYPA